MDSVHLAHSFIEPLRSLREDLPAQLSQCSSFANESAQYPSRIRLQGLNCLAIPPGVALFHSVSSFRGEGNFFCLLDRICGNVSCFVAQVIFGTARQASSDPQSSFWLKHQRARRCIQGSDSPTSRQLYIEVQQFKHSTYNEIAQPPSVKGGADAVRQVYFLAYGKRPTQSLSATTKTKLKQK